MKFQVKQINGTVLFEYECENNTIKKTALEAVSRGTDLSRADLRGAYLSRADLRGAYLRGAYLSRADLRGAYLSRAYLRGANLRGANLSGTDLSRAYLGDAYLNGADLRDAYLGDAYLNGADLRDAYLNGADLKQIQRLTQIIPQEGSFIGWKKLANGVIAKVEIPAKAKRHNVIGGRKCRASYIKTLQMWDANGNEIEVYCGQHDKNTIYKVGRLTRPDKYDPDPRVECSYGIHFFITRLEAEEWN